MSDPAPKKPETVNPDELMAHIRDNSIWKGVLLSVGIHVVLIGLTSIGFIAKKAGWVSDAPADTVEATTDTAPADGTPATTAEGGRMGDVVGTTTPETDADGNPLPPGINAAAYDKIVNDTMEPTGEPEDVNLEFDADSLDGF